MNKITASSLFALSWVTVLAGCGNSNEPEYSKRITECLEAAHEATSSSGTVLFFKNPVRTCLDNRLAQQTLPAISFVDGDNRQISLSSIEKPLVIQVLSNEHSASTFEREYLNEMVPQYSDKIDFIFVVNRAQEIPRMCSSKLYRAKSVEECTPFEYSKQAKLVYFDKERVEALEPGLGYIISGLRATEFPTTYYVNKDKTIFKLETIEDILVSSNVIYKASPGKSDEAVARLSFEQRVPETLAMLVEYNQ
ncbi:hypothetical protein L2750_15280 [Shewanella submarina]|uniref:Lipoprotein n=1 Tax=Shewanella submarina TaxID=2016376 RepID=A0ABV7GAF4_9GAMM|nr:hypothetical protein [Shewanella submarina]MCL1038495.1 hypothetical protein [Shewanella submarina]